MINWYGDGWAVRHQPPIRNFIKKGFVAHLQIHIMKKGLTDFYLLISCGIIILVCLKSVSRSIRCWLGIGFVCNFAQEFEMDPEIKQELARQTQHKIDTVKKELAWDSEKQQIALDKLKIRSAYYSISISAATIDENLSPAENFKNKKSASYYLIISC